MTVAETSIEAFYQNKSISSIQCIRIREFVEANPDVTAEEISSALRMRIQTVTPRLKELKAHGVIWITGRKPTVSGRSARTHRVATCPVCLSARLAADYRDDISFKYHCWSCGQDFSARVGEHQADDVQVFRPGLAAFVGGD